MYSNTTYKPVATGLQAKRRHSVRAESFGGLGQHVYALVTVAFILFPFPLTSYMCISKTNIVKPPPLGARKKKNYLSENISEPPF